MSYYIYSNEALPNPEMMGKPRYTPDAEYIKVQGIALPLIPAKKWMQLPDEFSTLRRQDWKDKHGSEVIVPIKRFLPIVQSQERGFAERGVIMLDHEPSQHEKEKLEALSHELNMKFRKRQVEFYENQRQIALARQGTYDPTPYVDECYELLRMKKPYSVEALQAQRDPGAEAATKIAEAMVGALKKDREDVAMKVAEELTRPSNQMPAPRR